MDARGGCRNIYVFIRLRLGDALSDREIARRWDMDWKGFSALKHDRRPIPRIGELERLAAVLSIEPRFVFEVARGMPAEEAHRVLEESAKRRIAGRAPGRRATRSRHAGPPDDEDEDTFRIEADRADELIFTIDRRGFFRDANRSLREWSGAGADVLQELNFFSMVEPGDLSAAMDALARVYRDGRVQEVAISVRAAGGARRRLDLSATRIQAHPGQPVGVQIIARSTQPAETTSGEGSGRERRRDRRAAVRWTISVAQSDRLFPAVVRNVSHGGASIALETDEALAPGTVLRLRWSLPKGRHAFAEASVVWCTRRKPGRYSTGVRFLSVPDQVEKRILARVRSVLDRTGN